MNIYQEMLEDGEDFINSVLKKKYFQNGEKTWYDTTLRFERELKNHIKDEKTLNYIIEMFQEKRYLPAGSISFGLGNDDVKCSLSNCYFVPIKEDSIEGIYDACKEMARIFSYRGGCGVDITILRPKNTKVNNAAITSSGAVSFMPTLSNVAFTIGQHGRRGAEIITIDIRHPDVLDFIWCKSSPEKVFGKDQLSGKVPDVFDANISIKLTNEFMEAVLHDGDWTFIFPDTTFEKYDSEWDGNYNEWLEKGYPINEYTTVDAKWLLRQIAESSWVSGDPGVSFWDNVIEYGTGKFDKKLTQRGFNPWTLCGCD